MKNLFVLALALVFISAKLAPVADPVSHAEFDELLKKYVSAKGNVDYKGFKADKAKLDAYCKKLEENQPQSNWTTNQKKAYWINVYNAFTIRLICKHYPVKSIKDVVKAGKPWKLKVMSIGEIEDLDGVEHKILRKMGDPRIHFGINCASYSCPKLLNKAFTADNVDEELEKLAKEFVNDPTKNKITSSKCELSEIFNWFKEDFSKKGSLIDWLNKYSNVKISENAKISHMKYNWNLNE